MFAAPSSTSVVFSRSFALGSLLYPFFVLRNSFGFWKSLHATDPKNTALRHSGTPASRRAPALTFAIAWDVGFPNIFRAFVYNLTSLRSSDVSRDAVGAGSSGRVFFVNWEVGLIPADLTRDHRGDGR